MRTSISLRRRSDPLPERGTIIARSHGRVTPGLGPGAARAVRPGSGGGHRAFTLHSRWHGTLPAMDVTLVIRVSVSDGELRGIIERVKTGEKERFVGTEALGGLVERMARAGAARRGPRAETRRE